MTLAAGGAGMPFVQVTLILDVELGGGKAALQALTQALRPREVGFVRGLAGKPEDLGKHEDHGRRGESKHFKFDPQAQCKVLRHVQVQDGKGGKPRSPQRIDDQPSARGDGQRFTESRFEHAAHERLFADKHAAEEDGGGQPQQHRQFPLNKTLIVQQQRGSAQDQHDAGCDYVHGLEAAGAHAVYQQLQHAGDHESRGGPVNIPHLKCYKKDDEGRPFEELSHAGIIADAMSIYLQLHPVTPQRRYVRQAVEALRRGAVIVYPTDSCYALGCHIGDKAALERIREIRQTDRNHHFTLVCRDLADVGKYAMVENWQYRLLRAHTPGPYTFLLKASRETPRRLKHERRGTIGLRVPDHPVIAMLLSELGEPVMSSTLLLPGEEHPRTDAKEIYERLEHSVDMVLDGGNCGMIPTSVIDLSTDRAIVVREGRGDVSPFASTATV
jgi:tRNA threonylcarbamoyl adenosine modification protein (Sua5/YciO/YrdC/YwlC family)